MANESQRNQIVPCHLHYATCDLPTGATPPNRRRQISRAPPARRLTWHKHKRKQLGLTLTKMHWLLGRQSKLSTINKLLLYKTILKPIWTYSIQLWGTASTSNIEILERFQSKALHMIVDAPWYVPNTLIRRDLHISTVKEEIRCYSSYYDARLCTHPSNLVINLLGLPDNRRLRRYLPARFIM
jgi:hypothetical protein